MVNPIISGDGLRRIYYPTISLSQPKITQHLHWKFPLFQALTVPFPHFISLTHQETLILYYPTIRNLHSRLPTADMTRIITPTNLKEYMS